MEMTARARKAQRGRRCKRDLIRAIAKRLRSEALVIYFDIIQYTKIHYKAEPQFGSKIEYQEA